MLSKASSSFSSVVALRFLFLWRASSLSTAFGLFILFVCVCMRTREASFAFFEAFLLMDFEDSSKSLGFIAITMSNES